MTAMTPVLIAFWTVLVPLVQHTPPASKVKAGWVGFAVVIALILAGAFLAFSLSKQLKKVNFEEDTDGTTQALRKDGQDDQDGRDEDDSAERENGRPGPTPS